MPRLCAHVDNLMVSKLTTGYPHELDKSTKLKGETTLQADLSTTAWKTLPPLYLPSITHIEFSTLPTAPATINKLEIYEDSSRYEGGKNSF